MPQQIHWKHVKASETRPSFPVTGFAQPACLARCLDDCSPQISREHYFSRSLLIAAGGKPEIAGLRFQEPGTLKSVGVEALTAKVLCERHNSALSPIDDAGTELFSSLRRFDAELGDAETHVSETVEVNGADVELWMLKVLLGLSAARLVHSESLREERMLVRILFGLEHWPAGWGLHVRAAVGATSYSFPGLEIETATHENEIWGAKFDIAGFHFLLALGELDDPREEIRRPAGLVLEREGLDVQKKLVFGWPRRPRSGFITYTRTSSYSGERPQDRELRRK